MIKAESMDNYKTGSNYKNISKRVRNTVSSLRPIDDVMFKKLSSSKEVCQEIIRTILDNGAIDIKNSTSQAYMNGVQREAVLDNLSETTDGVYINIDVQRSAGNDDIRRTRFHEGIITANTTPKGSAYKDVPNVVVIYISEYDAIGTKELITKVHRMYKREGEYVEIEDGQLIIYINATVRDGSLLSEMMDIFLATSEVHNSHFPKLCEAINYYKSDKKGYGEMCAIVDKLIDEVTKELNGEINELKDENHGLKDENDELKDENDGLKDENDDLKDENDDLKDENNDLKKENNILIIRSARMLINGVDNIVVITGKNIEEACRMQGVTYAEYCNAKNVLKISDKDERIE